MNRYGIYYLVLICSILALAGPLNSSRFSQDEILLFEQINEVRLQAGLPQFYLNTLLSEVARQHSDEMMKTGYFDHTSPVDGSSPYNRVIYSGYYDGYNGIQLVAENIGLTSPGVNVDSIVNGWMGSQGHAENILHPELNEVGVGIVIGTFQDIDNTALYTMVFAYHSNPSNNTSSTASTSTNLTHTTTNEAMTTQTFQYSSTQLSTSHESTFTRTIPLTNTHSTTTKSTPDVSMNTTLTQNQSTNEIGNPDSLPSFQIFTNSSISDVNYDSDTLLLTFNVMGLEGTFGYCNITIPQEFLNGYPVVLLDGNTIDTNISKDTTNYYVRFSYNHSSHSVTIQGSQTIPEFRSISIAFVFCLFTVLLRRPLKNIIKSPGSFLRR